MNAVAILALAIAAMWLNTGTAQRITYGVLGLAVAGGWLWTRNNQWYPTDVK